jgi:hypothetical protein
MTDNFPAWADVALMVGALIASVGMMLGVGLSVLAIGIFALRRAIRYWKAS